MLHVLIVGLVAGFLARLLSPGPNNPSGFILTMVLGIVGAFVATFIGQAIGHYSPDQGAGYITATIGGLVVLFIWNRLAARRMISDPGVNWPPEIFARGQSADAYRSPSADQIQCPVDRCGMQSRARHRGEPAGERIGMQLRIAG